MASSNLNPEAQNTSTQQPAEVKATDAQGGKSGSETQNAATPQPAEAKASDAEAGKPAPETPWLTEGRKALITQALAVLLTPLTVAVTLYLTEVLKHPTPRLEYVSSQVGYVTAEPPRSIAESIESIPRLSTMYRDELAQLRDSAGNSLINCSTWLSEDGQWDSDCLDPYIKVTAKLKSMIAALVRDLKSHKPPPPALAALFPNLKDAEIELTALNEITAGFNTVSKSALPRTGNASISVGVLNTGASDGTIFPKAAVTFGDKTVHVYAEKYVAVKAHDFQEIKYITPWFDGKDVREGWQPGDEDAVKALTQEIRDGKKVPFTIEVTLSDRKQSISGTIEP